MPELRDILRVTQDVSANPIGFQQELQRTLDRISESLDDIRGHRGAPKFYSDINMQGNKIQFSDNDYVRRNSSTEKLQVWDPDTDTWFDLLAIGDVNKLTTATSEWTMTASDNATDFTLTFSAGTDVLGVLGSTNIFEIGASNTIFGQGAGDTITTGVGNTIYGFEAGDTITTGQDNVVIGYQALANGGAGDPDANVVIGYQAGYSLQDNEQVLIGYKAGYSVTTGARGVCIGYRSGYKVTTGNDNVLVGTQTGFEITTGQDNVAIGKDAMYSCGIDPDSNVAIGYGAGYNFEGNNGVGIGYQALYSQTTGGNCTAVGYQAGYSITDGPGNVAIGYQAIASGTTGGPDYNVAVGYQAGYNLENGGNYNVHVGYQAGLGGTTSVNNILLGYRAGYSISTGQDNVIIGYDAAYFSGADPDSNVMVGRQAGRSIQGNNSVGLGYRALYSLAAGGNCTAVGYQAGYSMVANSASVFLGYQAGYNETNGDRLYIANSNTATPLIYGEFPDVALTFTADQVKIDTATDSGKAALLIKQDDQDQSFILFEGTTAADTSANLSTEGIDQDSAAGTVAAPDHANWDCKKMVRVEWTDAGGTSTGWLAVYQDN